MEGTGMEFDKRLRKVLDNFRLGIITENEAVSEVVECFADAKFCFNREHNVPLNSEPMPYGPQALAGIYLGD